jgi:hypothetical protein
MPSHRQSVAIIEPWPDVGTNPRGEQVRASKNIAYMLQQIADADTILYPCGSGIENLVARQRVERRIATVAGRQPRCTTR